MSRLQRVIRNPWRLASGLMRRISAKTSLRLSYPLGKGASGFRIPVIDGVGAEHLVSHEPWLNAILPTLLRRYPEALFVDVGANIGQTLLKVRSLEPRRRYLAFEPNPYCVFYLRELIRRNVTLHDVVLYPMGLSNRTCTMDLIVENPTDSEGTVISHFRKGDDRKTRLPVVLFQPDDLEFSHEQSLLFKIDVEGGEVEVLEGLDALVRRTRCSLICEVLPAYTPDNKLRLERQHLVELKLAEWDYDMIRIPNQEPPVLVSEFGVHGNLDWTNYVFLPREQSELREDILKVKPPRPRDQ